MNKTVPKNDFFTITFTSIRSKLLVSFASLFLLSLLITSLGIVFKGKKDDYEILKLRLNELHLKIRQIELHKKDFVAFDSRNLTYFRTNTSEYSYQFINSHRKLIELLDDLKKNETLPLNEARKDIDSIAANLFQYKLDFVKLGLLFKQRGFKDFGLEGRMRYSIHQIETNTNGSYANHLLFIRRYEKDFLLWREEYFVKATLQLVDSLKAKLEQDIKPDNDKFWLLFHLRNYRNCFERLVETEKQIGINEQGGLQGKMWKTMRRVDRIYSRLDHKLENRLAHIIKQLNIMRIFILFLGLSLFLIFSLVLTKVISKPIIKLTSEIQKVADSDFKTLPDLPYIEHGDETGRLSNHLKNMIEKFNYLTSKNIEQKEIIERAFFDLNILEEIDQRISLVTSLPEQTTELYSKLKLLLPLEGFGLLKRHSDEEDIFSFSFLCENFKLENQVNDARLSKHNPEKWMLFSAKEIENRAIWFAEVKQELEDNFQLAIIPIKEKLDAMPIGFLVFAFDDDQLPSEFQQVLLKSLSSFLYSAWSRNEVQIEADFHRQANLQTTQNITFAKTIQDALLPDEELLKANMSDYFIFFKAKDLVSGDFYWFKEVPNGYLIGLIDCTGHGVSGAFMTIIVRELLNVIVDHNPAILPNVLLKELNIKLKETMSRKFKFANDNSFNDPLIGLDASVVKVFHNGSNMYFSGAKSALAQKTASGFEILKGDAVRVGDISSNENQEYSLIEISKAETEAFYLFSDGFPDQLGGPKSKRFTSKNFLLMLDSISHLDFKTQHERMETMLENWKMGFPQVDDILVIGIKP